MGDKYKAFWLGIFIIAGIAIASWLILFLRPSFGDGKLLLNVRFSNIDKVERGTRVTFAGKPVGQVEEIKEVPDPRKSPSDEFGNLYVFELTLRVDSRIHVYSYDEIIFATSGLLGEKSIAIIPKAAPPGAPPPQDVTQEILFARSIDKLEETLNQIVQVADKFGDTMDGINTFISENSEDFNIALKSLAGAADGAQDFMADANPKEFMIRAGLAVDSVTKALNNADHLIGNIREANLVERLGRSIDTIHSAVDPLANGSGTLGRLLHNDSLYLQVSGMICKVDTLLNDINNYGLLFQYDKGWQRSRTAKINRMKQLCTPCDFYNYFDREVDEISVSLNRVGEALQTMECRNIPVQSDSFAQSFLELMSRVDSLRDSLKLYTEMLLAEYCQKCTCQ
ncbi:MAG: MCE family protein [Chlamydiales bacterium]|nr:MCE family protein [Chlamydiales bacterium]